MNHAVAIGVVPRTLGNICTNAVGCW